MAKRVTIMVDVDIDRKLRILQSKKIQEEQGSYSYSRVLNEVLAKVVNKKIVTKKVEKYLQEYRRVTIMIDEVLDEKIRVMFGKHIIKCATDHCEMPSWSYSREINSWLRAGFKKKA